MNNEIITVTVPESDFADPAAFEAERLAVRKDGQDPEALTSLVKGAELGTGGSLHDMATERVNEDPTDRALREAKERSERITQAAAALTLYDVKIGEGGVVSDILKRTVSSNEEGTEKNKRLAARVGYGPRPNYSSRGGRATTAHRRK